MTTRPGCGNSRRRAPPAAPAGLFLEDVHRDADLVLLPPAGLRHAARPLDVRQVPRTAVHRPADPEEQPGNLNRGAPAHPAFPHGEKIRKARHDPEPGIRQPAQPAGTGPAPGHLGNPAQERLQVTERHHRDAVLHRQAHRGRRLLLNENKHSISEIGDIVGYQDHSAFSRAFRRLNGCTPANGANRTATDRRHAAPGPRSYATESAQKISRIGLLGFYAGPLTIEGR
jgi:AraC-like DNA-binding protein